MRRYLMEYIGTLFLVLAVGLATGALAPLGIGLTLAVMIYAGGHISGAHYNPAVTLSVWLRGKCDPKDVVPYITAQIAGALTAALFCYLIKGETFAPGPGKDVGFAPAFLAEICFTFALCTVILNVATSKALAGNSFYGMAIGMTVTAGAICVGPISGGVFNPAVYIGPAIIHHFDPAPYTSAVSMMRLMLYIAAPCIGGAIAALVFESLNPDEFDANDH